jgi:1-acyl-sn-glycerol-3-phosphate acyltransferase
MAFMSLGSRKMLVDVECHFGFSPGIGKAVATVFQQQRVNRILQEAFFDREYPDVSHYSRKLLSITGYRYRVNPDYLSQIPPSGPVIFVSNHPCGIFDGAVLYDVISDVRRDVRIVANRFFERLKLLRDAYLFVDVDSDRQAAGSLKSIIKHLSEGRSIITFPAGMISRVGWSGVKDRNWNSSLFALAAKRGIPLVPIYINARASLNFYVTSTLVSPLAPLAALGDVCRLSHRKAIVEIGDTINPTEDTDAEALSSAVRGVVYGPLRTGSVKKRRSAIQKPAHHGLRDQIHRCSKSVALGNGRWGLLFEPEQGAEVLGLIGRFRTDIYTSSGLKFPTALDVDAHDQRCYQIVIWNEPLQCIDGTMRIRLHEDGLRNSLVETEFDIAPGHPLRRNRVVESGRLAVRPGGPSCEVLWRIAAKTLPWTAGDIIVGLVTVQLTCGEEQLRVMVDWTHQSTSPDYRCVRPRHGPDFFGDLSKSTAKRSVFSYNAIGIRDLRSWARQAGFEIPTLLTAYPKVSDCLGHYDGVCIDRDFENSLCFLHWGTIENLNAIARRIMGLKPGECAPRPETHGPIERRPRCARLGPPAGSAPTQPLGPSA